MAEFTLRIDGMHCGACVRRVSQALATEGLTVKEVRVGAARVESRPGSSARRSRPRCHPEGRLSRPPRYRATHDPAYTRSDSLPEPRTESVTLPVLGMTCAACQHHVEEALRSTEGVESARVDLMAHRASVVFDPRRARPETLVEAIRGAGYDAVLPRADATGDRQAENRGLAAAGLDQSLDHARSRGSRHAAGHAARSRHGRPAITPSCALCPGFMPCRPIFLRWTLLVITGLLMVWAGGPIFANAARGLRHRTTNMNTLVALGTSVAFLYSAFATIRPAADRQVYYDAVLLILGFLLLGKALEGRAKRRALAALDSLSRLRPVNARRIVDGVETACALWMRFAPATTC